MAFNLVYILLKQREVIMDIKKSLNVALAKKGIKKGDFAIMLGVSRARLYAMQNQKRINPETLTKITNALDMEVSEFIALAE